MRIPPSLFRRLLVSAIAFLALMVVSEGGAVADQSCESRPANAEEQKFYADAFAHFRKIVPPAPAGWTATDTFPPGVSNGVAKEVCAAPGKLVFYASFDRSYSVAEQELRAREAELIRKVAALMAENLAATKAGKPVNWDAFEVARKKLGAEAERDTVARFRFLVGHTSAISRAYSPVQVPFGKGYRQAYTADDGLPREDVMIVLDPATPKSPRSVVMLEGDPARVAALLKAMPLR